MPMVFGLMSTVYTPMKNMATTAYKTTPEVMVLETFWAENCSLKSSAENEITLCYNSAQEPS